MTGLEIGFASIVVMLILIYSGLHVAITLMLVSFVGVWMIRDNPDMAAKLMVAAFKDSISDYLFGVVPLFVLMGLVVSVAGIGRDTFDVAQQAFRKILGGLGVATVAANAIFAAITGISIASAAVFTKVAVPEMRRHGYTPHFSVGVVAGSAVLGMLIPPSLLFILYGVLTEQSVGDLFIAGVIPGLVLAMTYGLGIVAMGRWAPGFIGGTNTPVDDMPTMSVGEMLAKLAPIVVLVALVLGGIYGGIFTPTEAGAVGSGLTILIALAQREFSFAAVWTAAKQAVEGTASIFIIAVGAGLFARYMALTGVPDFLADQFLTLGDSPIILILQISLLYLLLGCFIDSIGIMLLTLPIILPLLNEANVDLIWFGVLVIKLLEIGLVTPPVGLNVFVMKSSLGRLVTLPQIFRGVLWFIAVDLVTLGLLIAFPEISTWLPSLMQ